MLKYLEYDKQEGCIYLLSKENLSRIKVILPDYEGYFQSAAYGKRLKMKYTNLCWLLLTGHRVQSDEVVLQKDLNIKNYKMNNLELVSRDLHLTIQEALRNMQGALRIKQSPTDAFAFVIQYREGSKVKKEIIHDNELAKKRLLQLQLKFTKLISKYICTS